MKCPNCGADIKDGSKFCEFCGSQITADMKREQEYVNKAGCPKCGSSNITFNREKQGEVKGKKGSAVVRSTVGMCKDCGHTWHVQAEPVKKRKTWLWVLGWIFIFPLPLTILMLRPTTFPKLDKKIKYGIIAVAWIIYAIWMFGSRSSDKSTTTTDTTPVVENTVVDEEPVVETTATMDVTLNVSPNVNADDGTVLFSIATNLPEDTELMVTVSNEDGYTAQDKAVVLANGVANTSEFSNDGAGLSGKYTVRVSMSLPKLQKDSVQEVIGKNGENISGKYVQKADISDANVVSGDFEFTFGDAEETADTEEVTEEVTEEKEETNGVDPDLKAFLDSYEAYMDEYCEFMENYDASDAKMLLQYAEMMTKYADFAEKADAYDSDTMSAADSAYYLEVMTRVNAKLAKVAYTQ